MTVTKLKWSIYGIILPYPTVPVCTLLPSGSVISGIVAPSVAEFEAARLDAIMLLLLLLLLCSYGLEKLIVWQIIVKKCRRHSHDKFPRVESHSRWHFPFTPSH